jgi:hypothetical protein
VASRISFVILAKARIQRFIYFARRYAAEASDFLWRQKVTKKRSPTACLLRNILFLNRALRVSYQSGSPDDTSLCRLARGRVHAPTLRANPTATAMLDIA